MQTNDAGYIVRVLFGKFNRKLKVLCVLVACVTINIWIANKRKLRSLGVWIENLGRLS